MKPNNKTDLDTGPWYKQFWAWFILSPLIVVVIVSSITVTIAVKYRDDRVVDNYYKEGRMINMRLDQDQLASQLSVTAAINFDRVQNTIVLDLDHRGPNWPETLELQLSHPVKAELDHRIQLQRISAGQYQGEISQQQRQRWYLRLLPVVEAEEQRWRLRGEIDFNLSDSVVLKTDS